MNSTNKLVALLLAILVVTPLYAGVFPLPASDKQAVVTCPATCVGNNFNGQPNANKPTHQYSSPIAKHIGRLVDSSATKDIQGPGTIRANKIRMAPGTSPSRVYVKMGRGIGVYSLNTFFTSKLPGGMKSVADVFAVGVTRTKFNYPNEELTVWDANVFAESYGSQWPLTPDDQQDVLQDYDVDDRGMIYAAYSRWGWAIMQDSGESGLLPLLGRDGKSAGVIVTVKVGTSYYTAVGETTPSFTLYNTTNPNAIAQYSTRDYGIRAWAKDYVNGRIALIDSDSKLRVYDNSAFVNNGAPVLGPVAASGSGKSWSDVTFDDAGNLWVTEQAGQYDAKVNRFSPAGGGYVQTSFALGESFNSKGDPPNSQLISVAGGYVAVAGAGLKGTDLLLFKIQGNSLQKLDLKSYFNQYYHNAGAGYAQPSASPESYCASVYGLRLIKQNNKLYVMYNIHGMGDVYEIEAGDSLGVTMRTNGFGTNNPNSKATETGPFLGDVVRFVASPSNPSQSYQVSWDFGNPTSNLNTAQTATGADASHQFSGYTTAAEITAAKKVTATSVNDSSLTSDVSVTLKVPVPRIGFTGSTAVITSASSGYNLIAGDAFTDASDGSVESHYSNWIIDGAPPVAKLPSQTMPAGAVGPHTLSLVTSYGRYDASTFAPTSTMYSPAVSNVSYTVRPFIATIGASKAGVNAIFSGTSRVTSNTQILTATTWTTTWTWKRGTTVQQTQTDTATLGNVPNFSIPLANLANNDVITLQVSVPTTSLVGAPEYATYTDTLTLETPVPSIGKTGCANAGSPCTLTATGNGVSGATVTWTLSGPATLSGTGNPYTPNITVAGTYTVSVTAVKGIFEGSTQTGMTVAAAVCGPPPTTDQITISHSCGSLNCDAGDTLTFRTSVFDYSRQACDVYSWSWGDNTAAGSGSTNVTHKYVNAGTYTVRLTVSNNSTGTPTVITHTVTIGGGDPGPGPGPDPTPTCTRPSGIIIEYSGPGGCGTGGGTCKSGDRIVFTAFKNNGDQLSLSCDTAAWEWGDGGTGSGRSAAKTYSTPGTYTVTVRVSSSAGSATPATLQVPIANGGGTGACSGAPTVDSLIFDYRGGTCSSLNPNALCTRGEGIQFDVKTFGYTFQTCDKFEWNFGDGSALATAKNPTHSFTGSAASYHVTVRVYNTTNPTGVVIDGDVPFDNAPIEPTPTITFANPPTTVGKGVAVTFHADATLNATGWQWNFGDGTGNDNSQNALKATGSTITHTFTKTGTFTVSVSAKNANDSTDRSRGSALANVVVSETPVYRFLLPAVIHDNGQNGSLWRTDVQVYYGAPSPAADPLNMTAEFQGGTHNLQINQATFIYEDFVNRLITGNGSGSVILTTQTKYKPQIWTRTYNVDPTGKTFGQFIPAIELTGATAGAVTGSADPVKYYLAGLRANARYRTNVGFINTSSGDIIADVTAYDDLRNPLDRFAVTLPQYQLQQISLSGKIANLPDRPITLEISIPAGKSLVAYASFIDGASNDPVYISATAGTELASTDYNTSITPGVGHIGAWRSDVTVFNPDDRNSVTFDLEYYDDKGLPRGSARNLTLGPLQAKSYEDLLRVTELFPTAPPDGVGMLKLKTIGTPTRYPLTFSRTYNDKGTGGTFGQGIPGFASIRANVKPGKGAIIPGVRSNENYKTNIGLTNASQTPVTVRVQLLDPSTGQVAGEQSYTLVGDASVVGTYPFGNLSTGTLRVEIVAGDGAVWAFASVIDLKSEDPEYVPASPIQ